MFPGYTAASISGGGNCRACRDQRLGSVFRGRWPSGYGWFAKWVRDDDVPALYAAHEARA